MYYRKHDSYSLSIATHPRIPTLIEFIPLLSIYLASSRNIIRIKRLITGKVYLTLDTVRDWSRPSPVQSVSIRDRSNPSPKIAWTGPGLDWTVPVWTDPLLDWWNHCTLQHTPSIFSNTLPIPLDDKLATCSTVCTQASSETLSNYTSRYAFK